MSDQNEEPYVPASKTLPEFTLQAVVLGLVLSLIMCAANMYVGLKAGMTVSAAIPASVISMGILRGLMKRGTILENNVVHTIASSGESLAAGIIFTVPALVLAGIWDEFNYWETTLIAMSGGVMGVVMMIPLRKAMIVDQKELKYPEGVACAEVLKAGDRGGAEMMGIFKALGVGALFKVCIDVVGLFKGTVEGAARAAKTAVYAGTDVSPMLMAVGFIVGWEISLLVFLGGAVSFVGAIPILGWGADFTGTTALDAVWDIWDTKIRFFGIGAMVVAGIYSIIKVAASIKSGVVTAIHGITGKDNQADLPRTERGITGAALFGLLAMTAVLSAIVYQMMTGDYAITAVVTVIMFVLAFFFVAVASYIVGLVGSSNSPVSGMTICAVLVTAGLLLVLGFDGEAGMIATLGVAGVVCCATCTSGDICQDLKIGTIIGATPRQLQKGEVLGTMVPALIVAPVLTLLHRGYGIGTPVRENVAPLPAPQGAMFEKLVGGLFGTGDAIPWNLVAVGGAVGILAIVIDRIALEPKGAKFRLHPMPLAVGMYLPWTVTFPILIGGIAYLIVDKGCIKRGLDAARSQAVVHRGLLFASGLVAGEAILGILIAILLSLDVELPLLPASWAELGGGAAITTVSILAFLFVTRMLIKKSFEGSEA